MKVIEIKYSPKVKAIRKISPLDYGKTMEVVVAPVINEVRDTKDEALFKYTQQYDRYVLTKENIRVTANEIDKALSNTDEKILNALKYAHQNILKFHEKQFEQIKKNWSIEVEEGVTVGEKVTPIDSVGCYIPGGRASYPSTVLMTCIPAKVAGVKRIAVASPPPISDVILATAKICGVDEVYRVGGAQAIGALAHGTESIKKVNKIVGPGNRYVMVAKNLVYGLGIVDIDTPAGPSEVLIIADDTAKPAYVAADILAQAEHDPDADCVLVTTSKKLREKVKIELENQEKKLSKEVEFTIKFMSTKTLDESIEFANNYAPEHLQIMIENPDSVAEKIVNAGAIFVGEYAPVPAGDYASGGNHVLPTGGAARYSSPLSVRDFLKTSCVQKITKEGLGRLRETVGVLAESEGLHAHKKSVEERFKT